MAEQQNGALNLFDLRCRPECLFATRNSSKTTQVTSAAPSTATVAAAVEGGSTVQCTAIEFRQRAWHLLSGASNSAETTQNTAQYTVRCTISRFVQRAVSPEGDAGVF